MHNENKHTQPQTAHADGLALFMYGATPFINMQ